MRGATPTAASAFQTLKMLGVRYASETFATP